MTNQIPMIIKYCAAPRLLKLPVYEEILYKNLKPFLEKGLPKWLSYDNIILGHCESKVADETAPWSSG